MINLIKNEYIKVFKKKGFLIMTIVILAFVLLTNFIYKSIDNLIDSYEYMEYESFNEEDWDKDNLEQKSYYVESKSTAQVYELKEKYDKDSWQYSYITGSNAYEIIYRINSYETKLAIDEFDYNNAKEEYEELLKKLDSDDWKNVAKEEKAEYEEALSVAEDKEEIETLKIYIEGLEIRLNKDISYAQSYMNTALEDYVNSQIILMDFQNKDISKLKDNQKELYNEMREQYLTAKYILDNNKDLSNYGTDMLKSFFEQYLFMLVVMIFMIAGSITSQEFSKGTIKLLLVKPYSRTKILISKYITSISSILISFIIMLTFQTIIGILFFGMESITTPVISYSNINDSITIMSTYTYVFKCFVALLPCLLILTTLSFVASTLFNNTALAVVVSFVGYIGSNVVTSLISTMKYWWVKFVYCMNWDLTSFLFHNNPVVKGTSLCFSIVVCLVYLLVLLIPTFIVFKNKDIKNV